MTYTRASLAQDIGGRLAGWLRLAGMAAADSAGNLAPAIDAALRQMGLPDDEIPTATIESRDLPAFRALSTLYALQAVRDAAGPMVDVNASATGVSKARSQAAKQLAERIADAERDASRYITVESTAWDAGSIDLGTITPPGEW